MGLPDFLRRRWWDEERTRSSTRTSPSNRRPRGRGMTPDRRGRRPFRKPRQPDARTRGDLPDEHACARMESLVADLPYGARVLRRTRRFTAVAILSLALGIGANTAMFELVDVVRLRPAGPAPQELVEVRLAPPRGRSGAFTGRRPELTNAMWQRLRRDRKPSRDACVERAGLQSRRRRRVPEGTGALRQR